MADGKARDLRKQLVTPTRLAVNLPADRGVRQSRAEKHPLNLNQIMLAEGVVRTISQRMFVSAPPAS
ncbi:hypothetical protein YH62_20430 [Rhizobium sp. LC145]|nr:hypothetical protein YH62_20430 [Rhizobium sp. LC145]